MPTATPIVAAEEELAAVAFDADGLVPAIVQEDGTGRVLMLAWMDAEALRRTLDEGRTWFWSRSRKEHWRKGDTKMRCYATVFLLAANRQVAMFRVRPDQIVERPVEKGEPSYSLKLTDGDLPRLTKLLTEIPAGRKCD